MRACTPSATINVNEAVLAPKPTIAVTLLHRGGLSLSSARDQRSHVLAVYTETAIKSPQTTIAPITDWNLMENAKIMPDSRLPVHRHAPQRTLNGHNYPQ